MGSEMHSATCWVTANSLAGSDKTPDVDLNHIPRQVSDTSQGHLRHMLTDLYISQVQKMLIEVEYQTGRKTS